MASAAVSAATSIFAAVVTGTVISPATFYMELTVAPDAVPAVESAVTVAGEVVTTASILAAGVVTVSVGVATIT